MKSKTTHFDVPAMAQQTALLGCDPTKDLHAVLGDYDYLLSVAGGQELNDIQRQHYQTCLAVLDEFPRALLRRDLALLIIRDGKLHKEEFNTFAEFLEATPSITIGIKQVHKRCLLAALALLFEKEKMLPLLPQGRIAEDLVKLPANHWLSGWNYVLAKVDREKVNRPEMAVHLLQYRTDHELETAPTRAMIQKLLTDAADPRKKRARTKRQPDSAQAELAGLLEELVPLADIRDVLGKHCRTSADCVVRSLHHRAKTLKSRHPGKLVRILDTLRATSPRAAVALEELLYELTGQLLRTECARRDRDCRQKRGAYERRTSSPQTSRRPAGTVSSLDVFPPVDPSF